MAFGRYGTAATLFWRFAAASLQRQRRLSLEDRLAMLPLTGAPISRPVDIHWDAHQIPFIEAQSDDDLATALGVAHAHLRLGQMNLMRMIAKGRVSEAVGQLGLPVDRLVRTFDIGRAVPAIVAGLPEETRRWLEAFVRGINHVVCNAPEPPQECVVLGLPRETWTVVDIVLLGRLIAADVNWIVWLRLLKFRSDPAWPQLWQRLLRHDLLSYESENRPGIAESLAGAAIRSGSNSLAIAGARSESGGALIANDPHLSFLLPNSFLLAGMKSPSYHAVGLMVPGIPFVGLGRNPWIGWGGASLHAASSDLVAVPKDAPLQMRVETIAIRGETAREIQIRESPWGPVVSDLDALASRDTLALRWMGHLPSDEFTAMLGVARGRNWADFRAAFDTYALPGLEMNYADAAGHIGQLMAAKLPRRQKAQPDDIVSPPENGWDAAYTSSDLPSTADPEHGFLASANARPEETEAIVGFHFSPRNRIERLRHILGEDAKLSVSRLKHIQRDVHMPESLTQRDIILAWLEEARLRDRAKHLCAALKSWDGNYDARSTGAAAFELIFFHLARALVTPSRQAAYEAAWGTRTLVWADILAAGPETRAHALAQALRKAAHDFGRAHAWGTFHRLRLAHPFGIIPGIGRRYRLPDTAASGTSETLMKTAHGLTNKRHHARYGSVARHISDMADPDANCFALLGGQDGWIGSSTYADQAALWERGEYAVLPLTVQTVHERFPRHTVLRP
ncbi:MAG TPA: penicillin acylase family protein [Micropepsaceae bacterium]|jgi:penicillin amidase|nr:penicillin acylase family protein [Micropepsaceae bacterium]